MEWLWPAFQVCFLRNLLSFVSCFFFFSSWAAPASELLCEGKIRFLSDCQHDTLFKGFILTFLCRFACLFYFNFPLSVCLFLCRVVWQVRLLATFPYPNDWLFFFQEALQSSRAPASDFLSKQQQNDARLEIGNNLHITMEIKKKNRKIHPLYKKTFAFHSRCGEGESSFSI